MSEKKIPLWIDTDTGVDDAVMLMCASELEELDITGVSAVAGNVEEEKTFRNARAVMSLCGKEDIKVYPGAKTPLMIPLETAAHVHGDDGLGGAIIPDSKAPLETEYGYDAMYHTAKELNGELVVAAVGPLTNIAIAIIKYPDITKYIKELFLEYGIDISKNVFTRTNFDSIGYCFRNGYIIKKEYSSINKYLEIKSNQNSIIRIDTDLLKCGSIYNTINDYCKSYNIFKVNTNLDL